MFYVNLFVWPLIFILLLATSIFILPPSCVERVTVGSLLILILVIMSLMLDSYTPKSSSRNSVAGKLIGFAMFMVTWSTVISTCIVSIGKDMFTVKVIPVWLKNVQKFFFFRFNSISDLDALKLISNSIKLLLYHIGNLVCKKETLRANLESNLIR